MRKQSVIFRLSESQIELLKSHCKDNESLDLCARRLLLEKLTENREYISGQSLSKLLGVAESTVRRWGKSKKATPNEEWLYDSDEKRWYKA
jgi:HTH domain